MHTAPVMRWPARIFGLLALLVLSSPRLPAQTAPTDPVSKTPAKLSDAAAKERAAALRAQIAHHDRLYFQKAAPEISDYAYDQLKIELRALERDYPEAAAPLPATSAPASALAGSSDHTSGFATVAHRERMLSLDKTYAEADVRDFHARLAKQLRRDDLSYVIEPKVDGLAVSVIYEKGRLARAITRGNGTEGDDVTANVITIEGLPVYLKKTSAAGALLPIPDFVEVRGEIFMTFAEFERLNREQDAIGEPRFTHPRNLAAGTLKQLDAREVAKRKLSLVVYGIGAVEPLAALPATQRELRQRLADWGLPALAQQWSASGFGELWDRLQIFFRERAALPFPTDGAVVKLDAIEQQRTVGAGDVAPRWAIAFKYAPARVETRLLGITLQVGRTGVITPVAELAPVEIAGSTVARATLHNRESLARRDFRIGDTVYLEKAGEIIPALVGVNLAKRAPASAPFVFPERCPSCGESVSSAEGEVAVRCTNANCPAQLGRRLEHFASRACVDIQGLGTATVDALVFSGVVKSPADLYRLRPQDWAAAGVSPKTAESLAAAIEKSRRAETWRLIHGAGLPQVGPATAKTLTRRFADLDALARATRADLVAVLGENTGSAVDAFLASGKNREALRALAAVVRSSSAISSATNPWIAGKVFVLTGALPTLTRAEATKRIEAAGGIVTTNVTAKTSYVVAGEDAGAKLLRARDLAIEVIDEAALLKLLSEAPGTTVMPAR